MIIQVSAIQSQVPPVQCDYAQCGDDATYKLHISSNESIDFILCLHHLKEALNNFMELNLE